MVGSRWNNIAPRFGIAWDVFGNGKTSIRAGGGKFFVPMTRGISLNRFTLIQPFTTDLTVVSGDAYNIFANAPFNGVSPFPRPTGADIRTADFVPTANETTWSLPFKTQTDYQWSLSLQQALGGGTVLELNYIGSSSANLFSTVESNYAHYIPGQSTIANTQARRLYPQFGQINNTLSAFSSNYNAMQVVVNRRYAKGIQRSRFVYLVESARRQRRHGRRKQWATQPIQLSSRLWTAQPGPNAQLHCVRAVGCARGRRERSEMAAIHHRRLAIERHRQHGQRRAADGAVRGATTRCGGSAATRPTWLAIGIWRTAAAGRSK